MSADDIHHIVWIAVGCFVALVVLGSFALSAFVLASGTIDHIRREGVLGSVRDFGRGITKLVGLILAMQFGALIAGALFIGACAVLVFVVHVLMNA